MEISLNFLSHLGLRLPTLGVAQEPDTQRLSEILTRVGFEVEGSKALGRLDCVVVGRVLSTRPHPGSNRLTICEVDAGGAPVQIVCGAPGVCSGLTIPVALPGAVLPGDKAIVSAEVRGVPSGGMLCGRSELGYPPETGDGLWDLAQVGCTAPPGTALADALPGLRDTLLDVSVTPNRPDMLCHLGVARELSASLRLAGFDPGTLADPAAEALLPALVAQISAERELGGAAPFRCENHLGISAFFLVATGVTVRQSPWWLQCLLLSLGQKPVHPVVDLCNYLLLGFGQPSHAFDLDALHPGPLTLREAREGESFLGLDGKELVLSAGDPVAATPAGPCALLGVLGGEESKVGPSTRRIVVEFAQPVPAKVRKSARRHGKHTPSSFAFEKGVPGALRPAAAAALQRLLSELDPGCTWEGACSSASEETLRPHWAPVPSPVDLSIVHDLPLLPGAAWEEWRSRGQWDVTLPHSLCQKLLGPHSPPWDAQKELLGSLGFAVLGEGAEGAAVRVPPWRRFDVLEPVDLAEEVARVWGLDRFPGEPLAAPAHMPLDDGHLLPLGQVAELMAALGYWETMGFHFSSPADLAALRAGDGFGTPVALVNPILCDQPVLHTTLISGLLRLVRHNTGHGSTGGQLFSLTRTFQDASPGGTALFGAGSSPGRYEYDPAHSLRLTRDAAGRPAETPRLGGVAFGRREEATWQRPRAPWTFHDILSHLTELCVRLLGRPPELNPLPGDHPASLLCHPGNAAHLVLGGVPLGWAGEVHPKVLEGFDLDGGLPCVAFEISMPPFLALGASRPDVRRVVPVHRLPVAEKDLAFVLREEIPFAKVRDVIQRSLAPWTQFSLTGIRVFDVYTGSGLPPGCRSLGLTLSLTPTSQTLTQETIRDALGAAARGVEESLGGILRTAADA